MTKIPEPLAKRVEAIRSSGRSIYDCIDPQNALWFSADELQLVLSANLVGVSLAGLALRTRSKVLKEHVCKALGFPVPSSFQKTQPRFPCLDFDTYVQKSNNLQIWNEEISPTRRYVLIQLDKNDSITKIKVITGESLAKLDTTGTLTQKHQASLGKRTTPTELVTQNDTALLLGYLPTQPSSLKGISPTNHPDYASLLSISELFRRLAPLVGKQFKDRGRDQERNRGSDLHRLSAQALGYDSYADKGQFPDIPHQLLEVKLQTAPTIDLGLVLPDSTVSLDFPPLGAKLLRHCDVRYAVFPASIQGDQVLLDGLILCTGEGFFSRFTQFQGKVVNKKLQIPLPSDFFD